MPRTASGKLNVLWATDGSDSGHAAIPLLRELVMPVAERIGVLAVGPHSVFSSARPDPAFLTHGSRSARQRGLVEATQLAEREATLLDPTVKVEVFSRWGSAIEEILKVSKAMSADLIVLGAKGHSNLSLIVMGSVSQGVVQHSTRPVLVARPGFVKVDQVVVGYEGSTASRRGVNFLDRLALPPETLIRLVYVVEPFVVPTGMPVTYRREAHEEAHRINARHHQMAERALNALTRRLAGAGRRVEAEVISGQAAPELDEYARKHGAGLIVVGSRKPSAERHYLLGSTAEKLVRHAQASVLVVR